MSKFTLLCVVFIFAACGGPPPVAVDTSEVPDAGTPDSGIKCAPLSGKYKVVWKPNQPVGQSTNSALCNELHDSATFTTTIVCKRNWCVYEKFELLSEYHTKGLEVSPDGCFMFYDVSYNVGPNQPVEEIWAVTHNPDGGAHDAVVFEGITDYLAGERCGNTGPATITKIN